MVWQLPIILYNIKIMQHFFSVYDCHTIYIYFVFDQYPEKLNKMFGNSDLYDGVRRVFGLRWITYPHIPLKNRLRASCKNSVRVTYYFKLFATRTEFLQKSRSLFSVGYADMSKVFYQDCRVPT